MVAPKWSDDTFLDALRQQTDPEADAAVARLIEEGGIGAANQVFQGMHADGEDFPANTPGPLREFLEKTNQPLSGFDLERIECAGKAFLEHALTSTIVLLASSLPKGYGSPALCRILTISNDLRFHPYKRLMGVVQLLINIVSPGAFQPGGHALVTAQKLRLLHAGVRTVVPRYRPQYAERYGPPVNHEDMLATIMAFSYLVISGLRTLRAGFEHEDHYYYLWRVFSQLMGIHPQGASDDDSLIPRTIDEAQAFYLSYTRRHYTTADQNPEGPLLAHENLKMMEELIPKPMRLLGFDKVPRVVMTELMSPEDLARVEIAPDSDHKLLDRLTRAAVGATQWALDKAPGSLSELLGRLLFDHMIKKSRGGEVMFIIPDSLESLRGKGLV